MQLNNSRHLLGPFTETWRSPLPAVLVSTLKSAVSLIRTPLGCKPRPLARQAFGLQAVDREKDSKTCSDIQIRIIPSVQQQHFCHASGRWRQAY